MESVAEGRGAVAGVRFAPVGRLYHFDYSALPQLAAGDYVIVDTARGRQLGQVMGFIEPEPNGGRPHAPIQRLASGRDLALRQHWEAQQGEALRICREKAAALGGFGDVHFVAAQYNFDGSVLTFLCACEDKLRPRRLYNALRREFAATVELRQIGPRDVARVLGGYGACGELRCCSTFLTDFSPVSIKMAKAQGISLNPAEITGMCGRLRCCLVYEYEQYAEARKRLPRRGRMTGSPWGEVKVIDVHPLQDAVTVITREGRKLVPREDLMPLAELRALQKKAAEPCGKHGDGACSCGKQPGQRRSDQQTGGKA